MAQSKDKDGEKGKKGKKTLWKVLRKLTAMAVFENAFVPAGANQRAFAVRKENKSMPSLPKIEALETAQATLTQVISVLKAGQPDPAAIQALEARLDEVASVVLPDIALSIAEQAPRTKALEGRELIRLLKELANVTTERDIGVADQADRALELATGLFTAAEADSAAVDADATLLPELVSGTPAPAVVDPTVVSPEDAAAAAVAAQAATDAKAAADAAAAAPAPTADAPPAVETPAADAAAAPTPAGAPAVVAAVAPAADAAVVEPAPVVPPALDAAVDTRLKALEATIGQMSESLQKLVVDLPKAIETQVTKALPGMSGLAPTTVLTGREHLSAEEEVLECMDLASSPDLHRIDTQTGEYTGTSIRPTGR